MKRAKFKNVMSVMLLVFMIVPVFFRGSALAAEQPEVSSVNTDKKGINIVFSREMNCSSVSDALSVEVVITGVGHGTVSGTAVCDAATAAFISTADLVPGLNYRVKLSADARDAEGNPLESAYESSFTVTESVMLSATIYRTTYGIPHIQAENLKSLAFGQGYAFAEDNLCILADQIVKIRSERSLYFGPGDNNANVISDFGYKALNVYEYAEQGLPTIDQDLRDLFSGYAEGYNKYLEETGKDGLASECRNAEWVNPITDTDLLAYYVTLPLVSSGENFMELIVGAAPPGSDVEPRKEKDFPKIKDLGIGSNGWGIGRDMTETGRGAFLANPHFPATGPFKFYESHLMIPGKINVSGASLYGFPMILIGFNENLAWTHTVCSSMHFNLYRLTLAEGNPTSYMYDNEVREMTAKDASIKIKLPDGSITTRTRTFYRSHYGVMMEMPGIGWTESHAYTLKDANENNLSAISQWLAINRAENLEEFQQAFRDYKGIPWANAIYADNQGNAFYIDGTPVPNFSAQALAVFDATPELRQFYAQTGMYMFPGDSSMFEWQGDIGPGLVDYENAPKLLRTDFVANSNDSPWLTNPEQPIEGYSMMFGNEGVTRSRRGRMSLTLLSDMAGDDGKFSADEIEAALFSNRVLMAELLLDDLIDRCQAQGSDPVELESGDAVDISQACPVLAAWDRRTQLDSQGAHLFREFASRFDESMFEIPFDINQPVATPTGLAPAPEQGPDPILQALARSVKDIRDAGLDIDARLGDIQCTIKNNERIPYHGNQDASGGFNMMSYDSRNRTLLPGMTPNNIINPSTGLSEDGYVMNYGTSFAIAMEFTDQGPKAKGILTYSQSSDSTSKHFDDQTRLYSTGKLRPMLFTMEEIEADPNMVKKVVSVKIEK
ncbi:MAG: hypothetical protein GY795_36980 [Desulfobacterales bacterium]|nr:hypothetical protein [Desulfobacterales bacterium]